MRFSGLKLKAAGLSLGLVFVVGACSSGGSAAGGAYGAPAATNSSGGGAASGTTLAIAAPMDGATVSEPFALTLQSSVALGAPETGDHHVHLYFDTTDVNAADYQIVYGTTAQVTNLSPGRHTIVASLRNADHSDAGQTATITVTVGAADAGAGAASPAAGGPSATPYVKNGY